jgi:hypothetical protein
MTPGLRQGSGFLFQLSTPPLSGYAAFAKARLAPRNRFQDSPAGARKQAWAGVFAAHVTTDLRHHMLA